ncbi:MAG TPA: hypothetical protein DCQ53_14160 [Alphaproteobacteria bacterium]|nr:hypothetical protein [Alphaproteobacteria bacterium]
MRLTHLATSAAIAVLAAACGGNDRSGTTDVDESTAASALEALHLATSGEGAVSWGGRTFDDGVYTFTDVVFSDLNDDEDDEDDAEDGEDGEDDAVEIDTDMEFDSVRAERMIVAAPRFDEDGNVIFDRLSIEDARFVGDDDDTDGGFDRFVLEQPNAAMVADFARGFSGEDSDDDANPQVFSTYRFETLALEGLSFVSTEAGEEGEFGLTRFAMEGYTGDRLGLFELSGLRFEGEDPDTGPIVIRLDTIAMENIGPSFMHSLDRGIADAMAAEAGEETDAPAEEFDLDTYDPFDAYESFRMTGLDANIGGILVTMDSMSAAIERGRGEVVMTSEMTPLVVRPDTNQPLGAQFAMGLGMLGYQQIELHGASEAVYDEAGDRVFTRGDNYFEMTDGFRIEGESDFGGYLAYAREAMRMSTGDFDEETFDGDAILAMFDPLVINSFVLRLEDHSLLDRALTAGSAAQGMSKEELRQQAGAMVSLGMLGMPAEIPRPLVSQLSSALVSFINEGGTITISVQPDEPISVGALARAAGDGSFDFDAYGITVTAEPADE